MSYFKLLEAMPTIARVTKVSGDGKQISVQTGPGQSMELDLDKDPNIDVSQDNGKTSIKLNRDNKNKLKKPGGVKVGGGVSIEEKDLKERDIGLLKAVAQQMEADAHKGDYTAIEELLQDVSEEELKGFLSDHRSPNEWPEEAVNEDREDCTACNGTGWERVSSDEDERACDDCSGTGKVDEALISEEEVTVDNEGNIAGYLDTIDEYVAMLFKGKELPLAHKNEVAYRIQAAVDDIRTRELGLKPSNVRSQYNEDDDDGATTQDLQDIIAHRIGTNQKLLLRLIDNPEGIEGLNDAIEDVASWFSGTTEVGSSDVSEMVKAVMKNLGHINDPFNAHMNGDDQISDSTLQKSGKNIVKELRMRAESSRKN